MGRIGSLVERDEWDMENEEANRLLTNAFQGSTSIDFWVCILFTLVP